MEWNDVQANHHRYGAEARKRWTKLSAQDWNDTNGERVALERRLSELYPGADVTAEVDQWVGTLRAPAGAQPAQRATAAQPAQPTRGEPQRGAQGPNPQGIDVNRQNRESRGEKAQE